MMHPITNIKSFVDELMDAAQYNDEREMKKYHELIIDSVKLVSCRMKDLLDQNLFEHGRLVPRESEFRPIDAIKHIARILENTL